MAGLEKYSYRIGVSVSLQIRLFALPDLTTITPTKGPAAVVPGAPSLSTDGTPGTDTYRRIWQVSPPADGGAPMATGIGLGIVTPGKGTTSGFDDDGVPRPALPATPTQAKLLAAKKRGWAVVGDPGDEQLIAMDLLPRRIRWRNNPHRVADELELELHLDQLPFPPDGSVIRSILVEMRRGVIDADDWASAMQQARLAADGRPLNIPVHGTSDDADFVGFADTHRVRMASGQASIVTIPCRDIAGVLADTPSRGRIVEDDVPTDEAIARFLSTLPAAVGMRVIWLGKTQAPILGTLAPKAKKPKTSKNGKPIGKTGKDNKTSCLELLADYCTLAAVTPTFRGYDLILADARTLDTASALETPRMVLGQNLEDLEFEHKLTQSQTHAVEFHCKNPDTGKIVVGRWPPDPTRHGELGAGATNKLPPTGPIYVPPGAAGVDEKPPTVKTAVGVVDPDQLRLMARNYFDEEARQEIAVKATTKDIATIEGRAKGVADLLSLRAGDPLSIHIAPSIEHATGSYVQRIASMEQGAAVALLISDGYQPGAANAVVAAILKTDRLLVYRVREIDFKWGLDGGTELEFALINNVELFEARKGGARMALAKKGGGSFSDKWNAVEDDMVDGEISAIDAARIQKDLADAERASKIANTKDSDGGGEI